MVICLGQSADLHMAQLMPLPLTVSCSSKSRFVLSSGFTFLVLADPDSPGQSYGGRKVFVLVVVSHFLIPVLVFCKILNW